MSSPLNPAKSLPKHPSQEFLRKEAKRSARRNAIQLVAAQRLLAQEYGHRNWIELMAAVQVMSASAAGGGGDGDASGPPAGDSHKPDTGDNTLPFLPLRGLIAFPHVVYTIFVGRPASLRAVAAAKERNHRILLVAQQDVMVGNPSSGDMHQVGTEGILLSVFDLPDGTIQIAAEGRKRALVNRFFVDGDFWRAEAQQISEPAIPNANIEKLIASVISSAIRHRMFAGSGNWSLPAATSDDPSALADRIASELHIKLDEKQALLETISPAERLEKILTYLEAAN